MFVGESPTYLDKVIVMNLNRQDTETHSCELPGAPDNIIGDFIDGGLFVECRRILKTFTLISPKHPYSRFYAISIKNLRLEKKRHLVNHYHMIHPLSLFNLYFDIFMGGLLLGTFIIAPILTPILSPEIMQKLMYFKNLMHCVLMILCFCTGYYDVLGNKVVLDRRKVVIKYLKTYFFIDIAGLLPTLIRILLEADILHRDQKASKYLTPTLVLFMYGRYFYCLEVLKQVKLATQLSSYIYKAIKLLFHFLVFVLLTMYVLYYTLIEISKNEDHSFIKIADYTLRMLLMINFGHRKVRHFIDIICPVVIIPCGFLLHLILFTQVMKLWYQFSSTEYKQTTVYNSIDAYMKYKALPVSMRERIWLFMNFKYQGHFYKDTIIRRATSVSLRKEIIMKSSMDSTKNVELFQKLPETIIKKLRANMVSEIFLPGDMIIKAGQTGTCMFFILAGTVKVTTPQDEVICHLRDGAHFGEVALMINIARVANVVAETPCELLKLSREFFLEVVERYPSLMNEIKDMAAQRMLDSNMTRSIESAISQLSVFTKTDIKDDPEFEIVGESHQISAEKDEKEM